MMSVNLLLCVVALSLAVASTNARPSDVDLARDTVLPKTALDDAIIAAMEKVRGAMINGTDSIPPLDPFFIETLNVDFASDQAVLKLLVDNTFVTKLAEFIVKSVNTNVIRFTMDMKLALPEFDIDGHYAMDGTVLQLFPLYGSGQYYIHVFNISMGISAGLNVAGPSVKNLKIDFTFESLDVKFQNLLGGGSIQAVVETVINQLAKQVVDTIWAMISPSLCTLIETCINNAIAGMPIG